MLEKLNSLSHRARLIMIGVSAFVIFLPTVAPASLLGLILPAEVASFTGLQGSLWQGSAQFVNVNGFRLNATRWNIHPANLILGRVSLNLVSSWDDGDFEGDIEVSIGGELSVRNATLFAGLATLSSGMAIPLSGQISIQAESIVIKDQWPQQLIASAKVRNLSAAQPAESFPTALGNYNVIFSSQEVTTENPALGTVVDTGGPLTLDGEIMLTPPANFALQANIRPSVNAAANLRQALKFMAPANNQGVHQFEFSGSL
ncbi:MAG: type II secretion system protein N [Gammaproteobacteria bacterium]|nr:type II secretion system protein N [Gammaproteobacteria bacterium]